MAAQANPFFALNTPHALANDVRNAPADAVAKLAVLHAEAEETARLANLLARALHAAIALPLAATLVIALSSGASVAPRVAWAVLVAVASLAIARAYATAAGRPFERAALHAFAQDLTAALVYSGCAWGAGAFLVLPGSAPIGSALVFAAVPALGIGLLLRERRAVLFFLAPVAALTSFACVLRQFSDGTMNAALVLIASAIVAATLILFHRREAGLAPDAATFDLLNL
jgi:hypothetical protein